MTHTPSPSPSLIHRTHARLIYEIMTQWGHLPSTLRLAHTFGVTDTTTYLLLKRRKPRPKLSNHTPLRLVIHTTPHYLSPIVMGEVFRRLLDGSTPGTLTLGDILDLPPPPLPLPPPPVPSAPLFTLRV